MIAILFLIVFVSGWYFGNKSKAEEVKQLKHEIDILKAKNKYGSNVARPGKN